MWRADIYIPLRTLTVLPRSQSRGARPLPALASVSSHSMQSVLLSFWGVCCVSLVTRSRQAGRLRVGICNDLHSWEPENPKSPLFWGILIFSHGISEARAWVLFNSSRSKEIVGIKVGKELPHHLIQPSPSHQ